MAGRGFANALRTYRATLRNPQWSVSAFNGAAEDPAVVKRGVDTGKVRKSLRVRPDLVGRVLEISGGRYTIGFDRR